jgi:hypothetical protein
MASIAVTAVARSLSFEYVMAFLRLPEWASNCHPQDTTASRIAFPCITLSNRVSPPGATATSELPIILKSRVFEEANTSSLDLSVQEEPQESQSRFGIFRADFGSCGPPGWRPVNSSELVLGCRDALMLNIRRHQNTMSGAANGAPRSRSRFGRAWKLERCNGNEKRPFIAESNPSQRAGQLTAGLPRPNLE